MHENRNNNKSKKSELFPVYTEVTRRRNALKVRSDSADFNSAEDLDYIKKKSLFSWKQLVKKQTKDYELRELISTKEDKKRKKKMAEMHYEKLKTPRISLQSRCKVGKNCLTKI